MSIPSSGMQAIFGSKPKPYLIAHRGNCAVCPENTLSSFRQAVTDGADILETDLHLSVDEEFICIHDPTVDRTTNGSGKIAKMSLGDIKNLRALDHDGNETAETIPTLAEVAEILPADTALALELKTDRFLDQNVCLRLADELRRAGIYARVFALSFSLPRLQSLQNAAKDMPIGWISMSRLIPDKPVELIGPFWPLLYINPFFAAQAHRRGMFLCPLDPSPEPRLGYYLKLNCDAIISNNPALTKAALNKYLEKKPELSG
jgi:glycerophosphoryl diester phosphodiesterase